MASGARQNRVLFALGLLVAALLAPAGCALLRDEPGLQFDFFPLTIAWEGEPLFTDVREPRIDKLADLSVASKTLFSSRWRGWLIAERAGPHHFRMWASDGGYLSLDGVRLLDTGGRRADRLQQTTVDLTAGVHAVQIGLVQQDHDFGKADDIGLGIEWTPPGAEPSLLPVEVLYARRPLVLYRFLRWLTEPLSPLVARLLGASLLGLALLSLRGAWRRLPDLQTVFGRWRVLAGTRQWLAARVDGGATSRRAVAVALFATLFVATWIKAFPWSTATLAGDDAAYLLASQFGTQNLWYFNRMVHVYLLKVFVALFGGGDVFLGSRVYGSFVLAATLTALAVAVRALGPRLQLRTLAVTLFLCFTQPALTGLLGAPYADYTLMMFLTLAVAVYLHGRSVEKLRPRLQWHAFVLGALTLAACKSKETGLIALCLPALLLWGDGGLRWRFLGRRLAYCVAGFAAALLVLMTADAVWMDDFWFAVRPRNYLRVGGIFYSKTPSATSAAGWMGVLWPEGAQGAGRNLGNLSALVAATPLVAAFRQVPISSRLLYLLPATFLLLLIVVYSTGPSALLSSRMLIPILPAACLVAGALFFHLGIERPTWEEITSLRVLVPAFLAAMVIALVVTPYLAGTLAPEALVPADLVAPSGWQPDLLLRAAVIPAVVLTGLLGATLVFHRWRARLAVALIATFTLLGVSFHQCVASLSQRYRAQVGEVILYPWREFEDQIEAQQPDRIHVSADMVWRLGMFGTTHRTVATLFFDRVVDVKLTATLPAAAEMAIASRNAYDRWRRELPGLEATATFDRSGQLVLLRPRETERSEP